MDLTTVLDDAAVGSQQKTNVRTDVTPQEDREERIVVVPSIDDCLHAKRIWYGVLADLTPSRPVVLDMTNVRAVDRSSIAALIGFVKAACKRDVRLTMCKLPKQTHAMLELLGVHRVVKF